MSVETSDSNGPRTWGKMLGNWLFQFMGAFTAAGTYRMVCFLDTGKDDGGMNGRGGVEGGCWVCRSKLFGSTKTGWWQLKYFLMIFPPNFGEDSHVD